jgi:hypothetical protein
LLAAAISNGVPHPPGYPLYMLVLQGWLAVGHLIGLGGDPAWLGNLFSVTSATLSVAVTTGTALRLAGQQPLRQLWAALAGLAWAISPLLWSQAVITEVYGLHALLFALLGWVVLVQWGRLGGLIPIVACGVAHHLTFVLLMPAVLYYLWAGHGYSWRAFWRTAGVLTVGGLLGLLFYLRTVVAASALPPPPVNWGYPDNWAGFWWLVSGAAYRGYLFAAGPDAVFGRIADWAYTLTSQYTPVGLAVALLGLSGWDQGRPTLRNFSLLWVIPVSIYASGYYTRDSEIYLLPVTWLLALWISSGLAEGYDWLVKRRPTVPWAWVSGVTVAVALMLCVVIRWPQVALRGDVTARDFVQGAVAVVQPNSIIITLDDAETFGLWYAAWGSGELLQSAPGTILINYSLFQFDWYRRLLAKRYPEVAANRQSVDEILAANVGQRPIFFSEQLEFVLAEQLVPVGPLWHYRP